jgi:hypothetical protein
MPSPLVSAITTHTSGGSCANHVPASLRSTPPPVLSTRPFPPVPLSFLCQHVPPPPSLHTTSCANNSPLSPSLHFASCFSHHQHHYASVCGRASHSPLAPLPLPASSITTTTQAGAAVPAVDDETYDDDNSANEPVVWQHVEDDDDAPAPDLEQHSVSDADVAEGDASAPAAGAGAGAAAAAASGESVSPTSRRGKVIDARVPLVIRSMLACHVCA